jgi:hypothetical protein
VGVAWKWDPSVLAAFEVAGGGRVSLGSGCFVVTFVTVDRAL